MNSTNDTVNDDNYDNVRGFYLSWVTVLISTLSALCNAFLTTILITYRLFRRKHKIIVALSIADLVNSIAIGIQYGHKGIVLGTVIDTDIIPFSTARQCALNPASFMETIGELWPAIISFLVGAENVILVMVTPPVRRAIKHRAPWLIGISVIWVSIFLILGSVRAFSHADLVVGWWCPRHKYISNFYGDAVDGTNLFCYVLALMLNCAAVGALRWKKKTMSIMEFKEESQKVKCHLFSALSAVLLVSIPNTALHFAPSNDVTMILEYPCEWCFAINSALSIVVCLAFLDDFRKSVKVFANRLKCSDQDSHRSESRLTTMSSLPISISERLSTDFYD